MKYQDVHMPYGMEDTDNSRARIKYSGRANRSSISLTQAEAKQQEFDRDNAAASGLSRRVRADDSFGWR